MLRDMSRLDKHLVSRRRFLRQTTVAAAGCVLAPMALPRERHGLSEANLMEARFYERLPSNIVRCRLCPRGCVVPPGRRGYCRVRENRAGRYVALSYGRPCAANVDPVEKKPFFHVYPGTTSYSIATVGCNIHCRFCQNWDISQAAPEDTPVPYRAPAAIAAAARSANCRTISYTYSEPTVFYEYMADCAAAGNELGLASIVVSNGYITAEAHKALLPLVKAVKTDLKAFTESFYRDICDGTLAPVLETIERLAKSGVWHEIVVLLIPTLNDNLDDLRRMSDWIVKKAGPDVPVHFSRYHPTYRLRNLPPTPAATLLAARAIAMEAGLRYVYIGNIPGSEGQDTICPSCKGTVVKRYGYRILENHLTEGCCRFCGTAIPGLWA